MKTKVFYTTQDLMNLMGCSQKKAKQIKKAVNDEATKRGLYVVSARLCSSSLFEEMYIRKG